MYSYDKRAVCVSDRPLAAGRRRGCRGESHFGRFASLGGIEKRVFFQLDGSTPGGLCSPVLTLYPSLLSSVLHVPHSATLSATWSMQSSSVTVLGVVPSFSKCGLGSRQKGRQNLVSWQGQRPQRSRRAPWIIGFQGNDVWRRTRSCMPRSGCSTGSRSRSPCRSLTRRSRTRTPSRPSGQPRSSPRR